MPSILENFRVFTNRHLADKVNAKYFLEDIENSTLATFTEKQVKIITESQSGDDQTKVIKYADITKLKFYEERPENDPIVRKGETLLIQSDKHTFALACLAYDWAYVKDIVQPGMSEKENDQEESDV